MDTQDPNALLQRLANGRTDLVWELARLGGQHLRASHDGATPLQWCAYYGDVSALRLLLDAGESLDALGNNFGLHGAAFHGHWRLCAFLLERGADADAAEPETGETALHAALCTPHREAHDLVLQVLIEAGADVNRVTLPNIETGCFMRDCRTKAEAPLHRAAAFGTENTVDLLLQAGADREAKDMNGDTPLSWGSWYARPDSILRKLCYGRYHIHADRAPMRVSLIGKPGNRAT